MDGPATSVSTGAGVVVTDAWFKEQLPHGESIHVGMEATTDTISAGQANAEHSVETLWVGPGSDTNGPGPVVLRKPVAGRFSHVVIEGEHDVLCPEVIANTPEVSDSDCFTRVSGKLCLTSGCTCRLRKFKDVLANLGMPGQDVAV